MNRLTNYLGLAAAIGVGAYIGHHGYEWGMTFGQIKMWQIIGGAIAGGSIAGLGAMVERAKKD